MFQDEWTDLFSDVGNPCQTPNDDATVKLNGIVHVISLIMVLDVFQDEGVAERPEGFIGLPLLGQ